MGGSRLVACATTAHTHIYGVIDMFPAAGKAFGLLLLWALWPLQTAAQTHPDSVCSLREQRLFAGSFEDLSSIAPIGLENCANLDRLFDADLTDATPLQVSLDVDETYQFATLTTLDDEHVHGDYIQSGLPAFAGFDDEIGVSDLSPGAGDVGNYLVEFNVTPGGLPGALDPLFVEFVVGFPSTVEVFGLGVIESDSVTQTGRFDFSDSDGDGVINRPVRVRENKGLPYDVHLLTNKQEVEVSVVGGDAPYISTTGNRVDFLPPDKTEGDTGTLELNVCDTATPGDCSTLFVPWEITDVQAKLAGYSSIGAYETVTNPNNDGWTQNIEEVVCQDDHNGWIIPEEIYKGQGFEGFDMPAGMGVNSNTGEVVWNIDCITQGPGYQAVPFFTYGNSPGMRVIYDSVTDPAQQSTSSKKPDRKRKLLDT